MSSSADRLAKDLALFVRGAAKSSRSDHDSLDNASLPEWLDGGHTTLAEPREMALDLILLTLKENHRAFLLVFQGVLPFMKKHGYEMRVRQAGDLIDRVGIGEHDPDLVRHLFLQAFG